MDKAMLEASAVYKFPVRGKCRQSCFANGWHRVGMVPVICWLDGACAGDSCQAICIECGKMLKERRFIVRHQPNSLQVNA